MKPKTAALLIAIMCIGIVTLSRSAPPPLQYDLKVVQSAGLCNALFSNGTLFSSASSIFPLVSSMLSYLGTRNGGVIYFENGSYTSSGQWQVAVPNVSFIAKLGVVVDFQMLNTRAIKITADRVTVKGFTIQNVNSTGISALDANGIDVEGNTIINTWTAIILESCNDSKVDRNTVNLTNGDGIYITIDHATNGSSSNIEVNYNTLINVGDSCIDFSAGTGNAYYYNDTANNNVGYGYNPNTISPWAYPEFISMSTKTYGFSIVNNTVYNGQNGINVGSNNGVVKNNVVANFVMYRYLIDDYNKLPYGHNFTRGYGLKVYGGSDLVSGNIITAGDERTVTNAGDTPLPLYDMEISTAANINIDSNKLFGDFTYGIYSSGSSSAITVTNNAIFSQNSASVLGIEAGVRVWTITNNRITVNSLTGNAAIDAPNSVLSGNVGYS